MNTGLKVHGLQINFPRKLRERKTRNAQEKAQTDHSDKISLKSKKFRDLLNENFRRLAPGRYYLFSLCQI